MLFNHQFTVFSRNEEELIEQEDEEENKPTFSVAMSCQKTLSDVKCSFDYTNNAQEEYYLLKRNTPLEGLISPCITVSRQGNPLEYEGIIVHRDAPNQEDFVLVKSGETVSASVKLNDAFIFNSDGHYTITYNTPLKCVSKDNMNAQSEEAKMSEVAVEESTTLLMDNTGLLSRPDTQEEEDEDQADESSDTVEIESCSSARLIGGTSKQRRHIILAHRRICSKFSRARKYVKNNSHYRTWFGKYFFLRALVVRRILTACYNGIRRNTVTYRINHSKCKSNWNAFTYKGSKTVYPCPAFHSKRVYCVRSGAPTKEGILMHEWTHAFGRTNDYTYGASANKKLAKTRPYRAIRNADTYEYFICIVTYG